MGITVNTVSSVTISQLSDYQYQGRLRGDDQFLFSQSGTDTVPGKWDNPNGRFPVDGLSTGYISRTLGYEGLCTSLSGSLDIAGIKDDIEEISGRMWLVDRLSSRQWIRAFPEVVADFVPGAITEQQMREWQRDDTWPDKINYAAQEKAGYFRNPRVVANIYEVSGVISALGVNDLSTLTRDVFNNNSVGRIISALNAYSTKSVDDESYISAVTDREGRVTSISKASLYEMLRRMFTRYEISDLIPGIEDYRCKAYFRDYSEFSEKDLFGALAMENADTVTTEADSAVIPEQDIGG